MESSHCTEIHTNTEHTKNIYQNEKSVFFFICFFAAGLVGTILKKNWLNEKDENSRNGERRRETAKKKNEIPHENWSQLTHLYSNSDQVHIILT